MVISRSLLRALVLVSLCTLIIPMKMGCQPTKIEPVEVKHNAIINGAADLTQPSIGALVVQKGSSFCTGTLITKQLVVTAAHCIDALNRYGLSAVQFRTDFADPNGKFTSEFHELLQVVKHPQYSAGSGASYDIAVMVLKQKVTNPKIVPIAPNRNPMDQKWIGTDVRVVGYGFIQTRPSNRSADQKYGVDIPLFKIDPRSFIHYDNKTPVEQRKSACHGDSGGPAMYVAGGKQYVMGVTSIAYQATANSGSGTTYCDGGAVSTRLDANMNFLRPFLIKYSDGPEPCKTDPDCGACGQCNQKLICEPKAFPTDPVQCKSCKSDTDCGTGVCFRFPSGFRCLQACTKDSCCPGGTACNTLSGTNQSMAVCSPEKDSCPELACKTAAECGPGEKCDATTSKCTPDPPPRSPELCRPCKTNADCSNGGICYGPTGNGRCTQECGTAGFCPDGFKCGTLYPGLAAQCVPNDNTCRVPCVADTHCPTDFVCLNKFCSRKGGGTHGDTCDPMPCKDGLACVPTASGKNCMQVCGIKAGNGGKSCLAGNKCLNGARCYTNSGYRVCIPGCTNGGNECGTKGGGTCSSSGNCLCRELKDCKNGYICNYFTYERSGPIGACVPKSENRPCSTNFECHGFENGEYCVPKGPGVRSIGEPCDSLNRCKDGLTCFNTTSGQTCFEDCTTTRKCDLGGTCLQVGRTTKICLCTNNLGCPQGRVCETVFQGYGVCKPKSHGATPPGCLKDKECPPYHNCKEHKCIQGDIPKPEPTPEPTQEPVAEPAPQDAGNQEPAPQPDTAQPQTDTTTPAPDTAKPTPDTAKLPTDPGKPKTGGGCGCQSAPQGEGPAHLPLSLMLLLLFAGISLRRQRQMARS